jgi:hypothetical protein
LEVNGRLTWVFLSAHFLDGALFHHQQFFSEVVLDLGYVLEEVLE